MAVIRPKGNQLDIQDITADIAADATSIGNIATGITTDAGAIATFDADYIRLDGANDPGVSLFTNDASYAISTTVYTKAELDGTAGNAGAKIDKVSGATLGNIAELTAAGVLVDSGSAVGDFLLNTSDTFVGTLTVTGDIQASGGVNALQSATTTIDVSAATAPTAGQILTAVSGTVATWQTVVPVDAYTKFESDAAAGNAGAKINKVSGATLNSIPTMAADGQLVDSGADLVWDGTTLALTSAATTANVMTIVADSITDGVMLELGNNSAGGAFANIYSHIDNAASAADNVYIEQAGAGTGIGIDITGSGSGMSLNRTAGTGTQNLLSLSESTLTQTGNQLYIFSGNNGNGINVIKNFAATSGNAIYAANVLNVANTNTDPIVFFEQLEPTSTAGVLEIIQNGTSPAIDILGGQCTFAASTTNYPSLNLAEGVAPSSPDNGDVWVTAAGAFNVRLNGVTVDLSIADVVSDTTPQLGGNLDVNDFVIVSKPAAGAGDVGGALNLTAADGGATANGGPIAIQAGDAGAGSGYRDGGSINLTGGSRTVADYGDGGSVVLTGGDANYIFSNAGNIDLKGGNNTFAGSGSVSGAINLDGGDGYAGGRINITGGTGSVAGGYGGDITIRGGAGDVSNQSGSVAIFGANGTATAAAGDVQIASGSVGGGGGDPAGTVTIDGGSGNLSQPAGAVEISGGIGGTTGVGGDVTLTGGPGGATSGDAGDIVITPGAAAGSGSAGAINITQTTAPAVTTDKLYNVAGALTWNGTDLTAHVDAYTKTESDATGPAAGSKVDKVTGVSGNLVEFGASNAIADSGIAAGNVLVDADIGVTVAAATIPHYKSYSAGNLTTGSVYVGGFYRAPVSDVTLTIGGTVAQTYGVAGDSAAAHAFVVASGAGGTDLVLTVSGISIDDAGTRTLADSEVVVADTDAATTDQYFETAKKWLGVITYTLTGAAGAFTFNYGLVKYEDFGNRNFTITDFEATGLAQAAETGLDIELLHHESTAFTYSAGSFAPNATPLLSLVGDHTTDDDVASGDNFAYKRAGLATAILGGAGEGVIIRVSNSTNDSMAYMNFHVGVTF